MPYYYYHCNYYKTIASTTTATAATTTSTTLDGQRNATLPEPRLSAGHCAWPAFAHVFLNNA
eukprot:9248322-Lingulodinium_polyedra.AAC.1